jgi:hypothetical protein
MSNTNLVKLSKVFQDADPADAGLIGKGKLRSVLREVGMTDGQVDQLFAAYGLQKNGVKYKKFLSWIMAPATSEMMVLYSSRTPDKETFATSVGCGKQEYDWGTAGARDLITMLREAKKKTPGGRGFMNICLACHGPVGERDTFSWPITKSVVLSKASQLDDPTDPACQVLTEVARCTQDGGRVDLLACNLLATEEGRRCFAAIEATTNTNFAASTDVTGNEKDGGDWIMESDGVDISALYFAHIGKYGGTFFATGMCGDEDLGMDIMMKGEPFHF